MDEEVGAAPSPLPPETSGAIQRGDSTSAGPKKAKKVRSACERCRQRRIKCDGQVPACGNCSKAVVLCVDVDGHDADKRIARGYTASATSRIAWLEDIIRTQLPHFNIDDGSFFAATTHSDIPISSYIPPGQSPVLSGPLGENQGESVSVSTEPTQSSSISDPRGRKRPLSNLYAPANRETSVEQDTRSVALDLGLLSLNAESRQVHYLGSSSGSLFASLLQTRTRGGSPFEEVMRDASEAHDGQGGDNQIGSSHAEEVRKVVQSLYEQLRKDLPSRSDCNNLLRQFFQYTHPNHPFLHRPSFETIVDALYQCVSCPVETPIQYNGWPSTVQPFAYNGEEHTYRGNRVIPISAHVAAFQLLVALSIGATLQIRKKKYSHSPGTFFNSAISLSKNVFGSISIPVLQSVLLLIVHSLIDPDGCNNVWTLTHIAMAHGIDLGIHREVGNSGKFSILAAEMRRRIFFCVYSLDRSISTIQGRPLGIGDDTFDVDLPLGILTDDPNSTISSAGRADTASMPFSIQIFKMAQHISRIKFELYRLPSRAGRAPTLSSLPEKQLQIRQELDKWLAEAFPTTVGDQSLSVKLKIHYHGAICLLYQPRKPSSIPTIKLSRPVLKVPYSGCGYMRLCMILGTCIIVGGRCKTCSSQVLQSCTAYQFRRQYAGQCLYLLWHGIFVLALICSAQVANGGPEFGMPGPVWSDWLVIHWSCLRRKRDLGLTASLKRASQAKSIPSRPTTLIRL
ncbi:hypothetical protein DL98DRAFT_48820 [Cadophora sp. DSE1049]|nr:hypothetical protein DL98DRAFT_48820 [Cadophora sp. DSE1049]